MRHFRVKDFVVFLVVDYDRSIKISLVARSSYDSNPKIQKILDLVDFYILPVMNPDGYEYSRIKNRMWRKNRRAALCKRQHYHMVCCGGVDLNRNFDWFWSSSGSSTDPCHETYHGPGPCSEPETQVVRDYLQENKPEVNCGFTSE
ncbi:hypothetical protein OESDEN_04483 [Oesophagostomum dentatum]|uniref:Peptidase M14 domain-containing protein n=1 Tax=Oesophagostomum dentatum TaxID=61180 RepID=A0A0B1TDF5_OESDE|nr:hypothetical protein OESDEN_04483 [Oesophagostomum dentatum]